MSNRNPFIIQKLALACAIAAFLATGAACSSDTNINQLLGNSRTYNDEQGLILGAINTANFIGPYVRITPAAGSITIDVRNSSARTYNYSPSCTGTANNETFYFFVKRSSTGSNKLLVNFMGGGACWDGKNCFGDNTTTYFNVLNSLPDFLLNVAFNGVLNEQNPNNPFWDYNVVFVPYCTGDIHWGSQNQTYTNPNTGASTEIRHRGFDNAMATLNYMRSAFPNATRVYVTGQSAGGYGAMYHFPFIAESFPNAQVDLLSDAANGVITSNFNSSTINNWGISATLPDWISGIDAGSISTLSVGDIMKNIGNHYPTSLLGQYTARYDGNQRYFYHVMTVIDSGATYQDTSSFYGASDGSEMPISESQTWCSTMLSEVSKAQAASNYRSYIAPGDVHTITTSDDMHSVVSAGVNFTDWINAQLAGGTAWGSVQCTACNEPANLGGNSCP